MIQNPITRAPAMAGALVLTVLSCATAVGMAAQEPAYRVVPVVTGLQNPWSIAFLPGGDMLITEKAGRLRVVRGGVLQPNPVEGVPAVSAQGQGGLLEVALHPNFAQNRVIYLTYSKPNPETPNQRTTALIRAVFDGTGLSNVRELLEARTWSTRNHFGSRIVFDRQGFIYFTVGDRQAPPTGNPEAQAEHPAQSLMLHQGKVMRLHDDGRVPADNPFVGRSDALPEIWSYGHRNPQGLTINPETGDIWETEHAAQGGDELNLIQKGRNYGWPVIGKGVNYGGGQIHHATENSGMEQPVHWWIPSIGTSGLMFYTGDKFPAWRGNLFAGGLVGQQIARLTMDGRRVASQEIIFQNQGRVRDIKQGPDGFIYIALDMAGGPGAATVVRLEPR